MPSMPIYDHRVPICSTVGPSFTSSAEIMFANCLRTSRKSFPFSSTDVSLSSGNRSVFVFLSLRTIQQPFWMFSRLPLLLLLRFVFRLLRMRVNDQGMGMGVPPRAQPVAAWWAACK